MMSNFEYKEFVRRVKKCLRAIMVIGLAHRVLYAEILKLMQKVGLD